MILDLNFYTKEPWVQYNNVTQNTKERTISKIWTPLPKSQTDPWKNQRETKYDKM